MDRRCRHSPDKLIGPDGTPVEGLSRSIWIAQTLPDPSLCLLVDGVGQVKLAGQGPLAHPARAREVSASASPHFRALKLRPIGTPDCVEKQRCYWVFSRAFCLPWFIGYPPKARPPKAFLRTILGTWQNGQEARLYVRRCQGTHRDRDAQAPPPFLSPPHFARPNLFHVPIVIAGDRVDIGRVRNENDT